MSSITSANSVVTLSVAGLYPVPQKLQGFGADRAWETSNIVKTESQISVDGRKTAGYVYNIVPQTFTLQGDSPSRTMINAIVNAMDASREIYKISGTITLPATSETFICTNGTLREMSILPNAAKTLEPVTFVIEWESIKPTLS